MTRAWSVALAIAWLPAVAHAQLTLSGTPHSVTPPAGVAPVRWPAVAFSPDDGVYLAVSGAGHIAGYWLADDGTSLETPFVVDEAAAFAQAPRVVYAEGAFLVTWHETVAGGAVRVRGRYVPRGRAPGASFDVSPTGTNWEMGAPAAWSSTSHEAMIAWHSTLDTRIYAQRIDASGAALGGPITVDARAIYFRDPTLAWDPATDTFYVAYAGCVGTNDCFVDAQRVQAGTGALVGMPIELDASIQAGYVPEVAYDGQDAHMLVVWDRIQPGAGGFYARTIDGSGTPGATVLVSDTFGAYDANGLAFDDLSGTFVVVTHGMDQQDRALELWGDGTPIGPAVPFGPTSASGNFNPRIAAHGARREWLAVTSSDFATLTAQRLVTTSGGFPDGGVPAQDAAIDRDGGSAAPDAASARDAGTLGVADAGHRATVSGGCGCRAGVSGGPGYGLVIVFAALVTLRRARPRPRARARRAGAAHRGAAGSRSRRSGRAWPRRPSRR